jgi:hypothetical protein
MLDEYKQIYLQDTDILQSIKQEQINFDNLPNSKTKIEQGKHLIINQKVAEQFAYDCLEIIGEKSQENDSLKNKNKLLSGENDILKNKLDNENIIYEDALTEYRKNNTSLIKVKQGSALQRGLQELTLKCKKNRKL